MLLGLLKHTTTWLLLQVCVPLKILTLLVMSLMLTQANESELSVSFTLRFMPLIPTSSLPLLVGTSSLTLLVGSSISPRGLRYKPSGFWVGNVCLHYVPALSQIALQELNLQWLAP